MVAVAELPEAQQPADIWRTLCRFPDDDAPVSKSTGADLARKIGGQIASGAKDSASR